MWQKNLVLKIKASHQSRSQWNQWKVPIDCGREQAGLAEYDQIYHCKYTMQGCLSSSVGEHSQALCFLCTYAPSLLYPHICVCVCTHIQLQKTDPWNLFKNIFEVRTRLQGVLLPPRTVKINKLLVYEHTPGFSLAVSVRNKCTSLDFFFPDSCEINNVNILTSRQAKHIKEMVKYTRERATNQHFFY